MIGIVIESNDFISTKYLPTRGPLFRSIRDNWQRFSGLLISITSKPIRSPLTETIQR